jgi:short-subunit dehydrogenase
MRFDTAFITGASSGLGRAVARRLAAGGTRVVLAARRRDELEELGAAITADGGRAEVCELDVADTGAARESVARWDRDSGGLDLVLANAGIGNPEPVAQTEWSAIERVVQVNTLGALAVLHAALGPMAARGSGTLSAVSSLAGRRGLPASAAYSASKAALSIFLEALRIELSASSVRVVDIRPGFVDTPMTRKNNFRMPFMLDVEDAAARAIRGLERGEAVVSFPWQASAAMGFAAHMPAALWRGVAAHLPVTSGSDSGKRPH